MPTPTDNRLLRSARREAIATIVVWLVTMSAVLSTVKVLGYDRDFDDLTFVWGIPDWAFWGILVPWVVTVFICAWFAFVFVEDVPLGREEEERAVSSETQD